MVVKSDLVLCKHIACWPNVKGWCLGRLLCVGGRFVSGRLRYYAGVRVVLSEPGCPRGRPAFLCKKPVLFRDAGAGPLLGISVPIRLMVPS